MNAYEPSWVDLAIAVVLIVGLVRGRKRGMSEEFLDLVKWVGIVLVAALVYKPLGQFMCDMSVFSLLSCYIAVYALIIGIILGLFALIKRAVGEKALGSDFFGDAEYYLGPIAGGIRYLCVLIVVLSFLNARLYSPEEVSANRAEQMKNYGMILLPPMAEVQAEVFQRSYLGGLSAQYLSILMIEPTAPQVKRLGQNRRTVRARENTVNEILN